MCHVYPWIQWAADIQGQEQALNGKSGQAVFLLERVINSAEKYLEKLRIHLNRILDSN